LADSSVSLIRRVKGVPTDDQSFPLRPGRQGAAAISVERWLDSENASRPCAGQRRFRKGYQNAEAAFRNAEVVDGMGMAPALTRSLATNELGTQKRFSSSFVMSRIAPLARILSAFLRMLGSILFVGAIIDLMIGHKNESKGGKTPRKKKSSVYVMPGFRRPWR
jgi:hypothetical protein